MRVLITGAGGFIGRHLCQLLVQLPQLELLPLLGRSQLDLADPACLDLLPDCDAIVHLAGIVGLTAFDHDPLASWTSNLLSTLHMLEHARRSQAHHLILASSYVYGTPHYLPVDENHPLAPHHAYQRSKYLSEQLAEQYAHDGGAAVTVLRLFNVYGPGQDERMLIPTLLAQRQNKTMALRDPVPRRDYVHVRDVAAAMSAALQAPFGDPVRIYNIGSGISVSVAELVEALLALLPCRPELVWTGQRRGAEVDEVVADISKAQRELGWQPQISLKVGLAELL